MTILGLDIGGANIKAADPDGNCVSLPFRMWQQKEGLSAALQSVAKNFAEPVRLIALTTTAELADCFTDREDGVRFVIEATERAFPNCPVRVWMTSGEFADAEDARDLCSLVAAANWHALATWAARICPSGPGLLIDLGSTTTDVIPLLNGMPEPTGPTDFERLQSQELIYTGLTRTPVCAVTESVTIADCRVRPAAEFFATTADVHLIRGLISEDPDCSETADGRPLTRENSVRRLARMLCCDAADLSDDQIRSVADQVAAAQAASISEAIRRAVDRIRNSGRLQGRSDIALPVVISGSGAGLVEEILNRYLSDLSLQPLHLTDFTRPEISTSACAFATARLATERCRTDLIGA